MTKEPIATSPAQHSATGWLRSLSRTQVYIGLALTSLVGLVLRLEVLRRSRNWRCEICDSNYYSLQGKLLSQGHWFIEPFGYELRGIVKPSAAHPPLMSTYLAVWSKLGATSFLWHRVAACFLGAAAVFMIGKAAYRIAGNPLAGLLAGLIAACYPNLWLNDVNLQAESIFLFTVALVIDRAYAFWLTPTRMQSALLGAAIALSALARAEGLLFFGLILLVLALRAKQHAWKERLTVLVIGGVVGMAVLAPWVGFNLSRFSEPVTLSVGSGYVMELGNCDATYDRSSNYYAYWTYECDRDPQEGFRAEEVRNKVDESAGEPIRRERAIRYIKSHLSEYPVVVVFRTLRALELFRPVDNIRLNALIESRDQLYGWWALYMYYPLSAFSIIGLIGMYRRKVTIVPFIGILASIGITMAVAFGITRYRVAWDVALCVLAAIGIQQLLDWKGIRNAE